MENHKLILIRLLLLFLAISTFAQKNTSIEHEFNSKIFESNRKIKIFIPERYYTDSIQNFTVTYILDAQSEDFWDMTKGNIGYLVNQHRIIPTIVVGIVSENRSAEFSPTSLNLMEHLKKEVFPYIKKEFRINNFKILVGHSWGGAFVGNTLFSENSDMFEAYLGISASLGAIDGRILKNADSILKNGQALNKYFYCSSGDIGISEHESSEEIQQMNTIINTYPNSGLVWKYEVFENTDHWSCVIPSINSGLLKISRNYFADEKVIKEFISKNPEKLKEHIIDFYKNRQDVYGYSYLPNSTYWELVADNFSELEEFEAAKELYLLSIEKGNNKDVVLYFKLSQTYEALKDDENTVLLLKKTAIMLDEQKGTLKESLYRSLKKAVDKSLKKFE